MADTLEQAVAEAWHNFRLVGGTEMMRSLQSYETTAQHYWAGRLDAYALVVRLVQVPGSTEEAA